MSSTRVRSRLPLALAVGLLLAGALFLSRGAQSAGQNKIVYDQFDWSIYQSTHFDVFHYSRERQTLQKVVSMAESAYDELSRRLNYQIPKRIPIIYYATHAEFEQNNIELNFIPEGVGAFAEPARNRMVLPIDLPDEKLQALIQHELTHVFQYEILFGGRLSRALTANVPTWVVEGMASYYGNDEDDKDRMFLRDAVNQDLIPPITKVNIEGYPAYRYGHAVYDFMEAEWGKDAVRDFLFEYRSFLGRDVAVALRRAFEIQPDDFDLKFRRYLRRKYLPLLATKGEASEYGERFRVGPYGRESFEIGAAPSPSGDFVATLTTYKDEVDIALLSVRDRKLYKNLSAGRTTKYEYIVGQYLTAGPESGRDLSFAPDGDRIAVFGRQERGRKLLIFSARRGGLLERISVAPDVPLAPSWSPDGNSIVFSGIEGNSRDIFLLDLKSKAVRNLTNDPEYDEAPVFSPDGKFIYHSKIVAGFAKIVRFPLDDPSKAEQVTWGDGNDEDPSFSPDGKRIYFTSSRGGIYNIYGQDLASGEIYQYTDVIGAALGPAALLGPDGQEKIVFSGFQGLRFQLYAADAKKPFRKLDERALPPAPVKTGGTASFVPAVEVAVDPEKQSRPKFKMFLDNAQVLAGVNSDQTFVSQILLSFSDYLGDRRAFFQFDSVSTFSNFRVGFFNIAKRFQWGVQLYDDRSYFYAYDYQTGDFTRDQRIQRNTGISLNGYYPISRYTRLEGNIGFVSRALDVPFAATNLDGTQQFVFEPRSDNVPTAGIGFSYDTTRYASFGPQGGKRLDINLQYTPSFKTGETTLTLDTFVDGRIYLPLSRRVLFAVRAFGGLSHGSAPTVFYFGGLDTLRGFDYASIIGNKTFYVNTEFRFPLVDVLATPVLQFGGIRGRIFLDIGGAWLTDQTFQFWQDGRLKDGHSSFGAGFSVYFLGLPWNVDFSKQWDFHSTLSDTRATFYVGTTF
jgi:Tol biopolymer transport system component